MRKYLLIFCLATAALIHGAENLDPCRVTVMGSSVANGEGAVKDENGVNKGYAYLYDQQLKERYLEGKSVNPFYISNISVNGNSSVDLLNRFADLEKDPGQWVIYGISLGNEGIHDAADREAVYNQWHDNMLSLIKKARDLGKEVVVMNNYTRGDFNSQDYEYVKRINDEIAFWDVPSVNLLGAIDDGNGKWAEGYQNGPDIYHPNTEGHEEFFYAMPPSLFDAMLEAKPLAKQRIMGNVYHIPADSVIEFSPEGTVHSFTLALSALLKGDGRIASIKIADTTIPLIINKEGGIIKAILPDGNSLSLPASENLDEIVLSQNFAGKKLFLSVNGNTREFKDFKPFSPVSVEIGPGETNKDGILLGEIMFYRSSMGNSSPFTDNGNLNKSSLEIYLPVSEVLENLAMSKTSVDFRKVP